MAGPDPLPDIVALLRADVETLPPAARPGFIAQLERGSAFRYRAWADETRDAALAVGLRLCAAREDAIADMIDATYPLPAGAEADFDALRKRVGSTLAGVVSEQESLERRFAVQANAERGGARTWRELAQGAAGDAERWTLEVCAGLEEESADFLEAAIPRVGS